MVDIIGSLEAAKRILDDNVEVLQSRLPDKYKEVLTPKESAYEYASRNLQNAKALIMDAIITIEHQDRKDLECQSRKSA